jgi:uncharacterized peroxidase-related enzyme
MTRIQPIAPENATGKAKELLNAVKGKLGMVPNMARTMANAPAVLDGYLAFSGSLAKGALTAKLRERIALTVAERNSCEYCLAAHSAIGKMVGLSEEQVLDSRHAKAIDSKTDAVLRFAGQLVDNRGRVSEVDLNELRNVGVDDPTIAEVVANVALNIFTNYFNHVSDPAIDFPKVAPLSVEADSCGTSGTCCSSH